MHLQIAAQVSLTKTMLGYHKDKRKLELELASLSGGLQQLSLATAAIEALGPQGNVQVLESQLNHMKGEAESKLLQSAKAASGGASWRCAFLRCGRPLVGDGTRVED